jgi:hypothetical protein
MRVSTLKELLENLPDGCIVYTRSDESSDIFPAIKVIMNCSEHDEDGDEILKVIIE